jgi:hypothetical protein
MNQLFSFGIVPDEFNYKKQAYDLCKKKYPYNNPELHERVVNSTVMKLMRKATILQVVEDYKSFDERTRKLKLALMDEINRLEW